ncbi:nuclease-related domain-containing protein [Piscibacillus halophilus]|uniref:Nuclease-related domain-containing protein n=1 Tax=Piscibacillus halophilus TaxID=571933 RepID=A0A1H9GPP2_9BACI|nr:NERD domain-containing protein [Piscibacillus halophilus]SEQ52041.1 Nuclease-related domain-containing protein [Piscibacillus halophilus]
MILKELQISPYLLQLESIIRRVPPNHPSFENIRDVLIREQAGYYGEAQLVFPISKLDFQHDDLHNLRLQYNGHYFQLDFLLLTPRFLLIIEAKNYRDQVIFDDEFNQVLHKDKVYQDPVVQVEEQKYQLEMWLQTKGFPHIPVETVVAMTNSQTLLKTSSENSIYKEKVVTLPKLTSKIREISSRYPKPCISVSEMKWLGSQFIKEHKDYVSDIFLRTRINKSELASGVVCPNCGEIGMKIRNLRWDCSNCGFRSSDAYRTTLKDFYLLIGNEITNCEFRKFTGISSSSTAKAMLRRSNFPKLGTRRYTKYKLSFNYAVDFDYLKNRNIYRSRKHIYRN